MNDYEFNTTYFWDGVGTYEVEPTKYIEGVYLDVYAYETYDGVTGLPVTVERLATVVEGGNVHNVNLLEFEPSEYIDESNLEYLFGGVPHFFELHEVVDVIDPNNSMAGWALVFWESEAL